MNVILIGIERQSNGTWAVRVGARIVLTDESYTVASNVAESLRTGAQGVSECDEVARGILAASCVCGHAWDQHTTRTANGSDSCTHFGCGCSNVLRPMPDYITRPDSEQFPMSRAPGSLYQALLAAGATLASHESDLYTPVTEASRALVEKHRARGSVSTFRNNQDGTLWYDIPFAYEPFWVRRSEPRWPEEMA